MSNSRHERSFSIVLRKDVFAVLILVAALGWFCAIVFMSRETEAVQLKLSRELAFEFFKTIFIAAFVGFILDRYLRGIFGASAGSQLSQSGIHRVYRGRWQAAPDIEKALQSTKSIDIVGISLRDLLGPNRPFSEAWSLIRDRLIEEAKDRRGNEEKRLRVRLLMLYPRSSEGLARLAFEQSPEGGEQANLVRDVASGLVSVKQIQARIHRAVHGSAPFDDAAREKVSKYLDVKLYHHCPFSFNVITEKEAFVEQYYYRDQSRNVELPILCYSGNDQRYEFQGSFEQIWKRSRPGVLDDSETGTAIAIQTCGIRNIYSREERSFSADRQIKIVKGCVAGKIRIASISATFYRNPDMMRELVAAMDRGIEVEFLVLNPVCEQAVLRALADNQPEQIAAKLKDWTWEKHRETRLYTDVRGTYIELGQRMLPGRPLKVNLYHSSPSCALLLTHNSAFVEQYIYGRSLDSVKNDVLGGEYPLFEFERRGAVAGDTPEMQLLSSTFEIVWKNYSVSLDEYKTLDEQKQFDTTMENLRRWIA